MPEAVTVNTSWLFLAILGLLIGVGAFWAGRKATKHPEYFREKFESPLDAAARALAAQGWTPAQMDQVLLGWANRDLTAKVSNAYQGLPPDILEAANKISEYAKANAPKS